MPFYISAWIATISFGLVVVIVKAASKYSIPNPWLFNFLAQSIFVLFLIPTIILNKVLIPTDWFF